MDWRRARGTCFRAFAGGGGSTGGGGTSGSTGTQGSGGVSAGGSRSGGGANGGGGGANGGGGGANGGGGTSNGGAGTTSVDPCSMSQTSGTANAYCGGNLGGAANINVLYWCQNMSTARSLLCPEGCHSSAVGLVDYCLESSDPCINSFVDGVACGANLSPDADANTLYTCANHTTTSNTVCASDCHASPFGQAD